MDEDLNDGLFNIAISDDETPSGSTDTGSARNGNDAPAPRADRNAQSEAEYLALKKEYRPKVDNGEVSLRKPCCVNRRTYRTRKIWRTIKLPFGEVVPKPAAQELLHAVEELYYFRRFEEAAALVQKVFVEGNGDALDRDTKDLLRVYETRCLSKLGRLTESSGHIQE